MKSMCEAETLRPRSARSSGDGVAEHPRQARAERDVRGGVLVEQRVAEDDAGVADARRSRRPARARRAAGRPRPSRSRPAPRRRPVRARTSTISPPLNSSSRSSTSAPRRSSGIELRTTPSARSRCGLVNASSVGTFAACTRPLRVRPRRGDPARALDQADLEVRAGPAVAERVEAAGGQLGRARLELVPAPLPGRPPDPARRAAGRGRSASQRRATSGSPKTSLGPAGGRIGDGRPGQVPLEHAAEPLALEVARARLRHPRRIEVRGRSRRVPPSPMRDRREAALDRLLHRRGQPGRRVAERVVRPRGDERAPHVRVGVQDVHVAGARRGTPRRPAPPPAGGARDGRGSAGRRRRRGASAVRTTRLA